MSLSDLLFKKTQPQVIVFVYVLDKFLFFVVLMVRSVTYGVKQALITLNIKQLCFREKHKLEVRDLKNCDDLSFNTIYAPVNQHIL